MKVLGLGAYKPATFPGAIRAIARKRPYKTILSDTFNAVINGTPITGRPAEVGSPWVNVATQNEHDTNFSLGGSAQPGILTNTNGNKTDTGRQDYTIKTTVQYPSGAPDATRYMGVYVRDTFSHLVRMDGVVTAIYEGATARSFAFTAPVPAVDTPHDMKTIVSGSTITGTINGDNSISYGVVGAGSLVGLYGVPWSPGGTYIFFNIEGTLL